MEEEAYSLFVRYHLEERYLGIEGDKECRKNIYEVSSVSLQRIYRDGDRYQRVVVDFDPMTVDVCYLVIAYYNSNNVGLVVSNIPRIVAIVASKSEANALKEEVVSSLHKKFRESREKFDRAEIIAADINKKKQKSPYDEN